MKTSSGASVRQIRSRTRQTIAGYRLARRVTGLAMRQSLLRHRATVIASLRAAFTGATSYPGSPALSHDPITSTGPPSSAIPYAERTSLWELWPATRDDEGYKADRSDELLQVVRVVQNHPEGICARDIGNELGTDWRRVLGLARSLVESGMVEQVDESYYPIAKAPRR
jgi:hypothetical protein